MTLEPLMGLRVVDLFAGSGALGIEALSRGAAFVDFVESHRDARHVLEENVKSLELKDRCRVWSVTLPRGLSRLSGALAAADLVLSDPPYDDPAAEATLDRLGEPGVLRERTRVIYEHSSRQSGRERAGILVRRRLRTYGDTSVGIYVADAAGAATSIQDEEKP